MNLYLLNMTEAGSDLSPSYEVNQAFVIVAETPDVARLLASNAAIDEPRRVWLDPLLSTCVQVGAVTHAKFIFTRILCAENNAS